MVLHCYIFHNHEIFQLFKHTPKSWFQKQFKYFLHCDESRQEWAGKMSHPKRCGVPETIFHSHSWLNLEQCNNYTGVLAKTHETISSLSMLPILSFLSQKSPIRVMARRKRMKLAKNICQCINEIQFKTEQKLKGAMSGPLGKQPINNKYCNAFD